MKRRTFLKGIGTAATLPIAGCSVMRSAGSAAQGSIPRRVLGKTGIEVSMLGFGSHLKKECQANPKLRDQMIKAGYEGGINFFDVYDHSGYLQFEPMGRSLKGFRKNTVVSVCLVLTDDKAQEEIDGALVKFQTDYIDCYRTYTVNDTRIALLDKNKKAGKIRSIGVVTHDVNQMTKYLDQYGDTLDYVMLPFNFHHNNGYFTDKKGYTDNDYTAFIPRCEKMRLGILGIKPMGSDHMVELAKKQDLLKKGDVQIAQAMLRYVYQIPEVDCAMPAMNTMEEVKVNLRSAYKPALSTEERQMLAKLSGIAAETKSAYLPPHYRWLENWARKEV
ncbi:MAG: aldo/keto reductase [Candidatus Latescibacter sp.]|nr:aldo/keto reductase [Candidatus Latescibacter sp.]